MKLIRKFLLFILLANFSFFSFAFEINSTTFDQRIDTGGYKEYRIKNNSDKPIRYKIDITKPDDGKADMSKWIKIYPKVINIPPLQEGTLKVYAQSPKEANNGEYFCNLLIKPLVIPKIYEHNGKVSGTSRLSFAPIIELSGYIGDLELNNSLNLKNFSFKKENSKLVFLGEIENASFAGIQIGINFIGKNQTYLGGKWIGKIKSNESRKFKIDINYIKNKDDIKEIILYNAENLVDIKSIKL